MRNLRLIALLLLAVACDTLTKTAEYSFNRYNASSPSMAPAIPVGTNFSVLSADTFKLNQIIVFYPPAKNFPTVDTTQYWVCRVVGVSGDKLQMKMGKLLRNGEPYSFNVRLKHSYRVSTSMPLNEKRMEEFEYAPSGIEEYVFHLSDAELPSLDKNKAIKKVEPLIMDPGQRDAIFVGGNRDNWGPLTIPANHYFVLGDNRHNALDSRYLGFIPSKNVKGYAVVEN